MVRILIFIILAELSILFLISRSILRIAVAKELNSTKYITYTILLWFGFQGLFYIVGLLLFKTITLGYLFSLIGASLGGLVAYNIVKNTPQAWTDYKEVKRP